MIILFIGYLIIGLVFAFGMLIPEVVIEDKKIDFLAIIEFWCHWLLWPIGMIDCIIELNK